MPSNRDMQRARAALERARKVPGLLPMVTTRLEAWTRDVDAAARGYRSFHWGLEPDELTLGPVADLRPGDPVWALGELADLTYLATKGRTRALWCHAFEKPRPVLASSVAGRLAIVGGDYRVTRRGIVG